MGLFTRFPPGDERYLEFLADPSSHATALGFSGTLGSSTVRSVVSHLKSLYPFLRLGFQVSVWEGRPPGYSATGSALRRTSDTGVNWLLPSTAVFELDQGRSVYVSLPCLPANGKIAASIPIISACLTCEGRSCSARIRLAQDTGSRPSGGARGSRRTRQQTR
jgi:hypothetical protein